jgi:quercetin dioxygenase-like cupin family protein
MKMRWMDRTFQFTTQVELFPTVAERLRGTPARLEEKVRSLSPSVLTRRDGEAWSMQEHLGHLLDLDELHLGRLEDYQAGAETLRAADMQNKKTQEADHNHRETKHLLQDFRRERRRFVERLVRGRARRPPPCAHDGAAADVRDREYHPGPYRRSMMKMVPAAALCAALAAPLAATAQEAHAVHAAMAKFDVVPNIPECAKAAVAHGDPAAGPSVLLVRSTAACRIPRHWHTPNEQLMVVSGTARLGMKDQTAESLRPGDYAYVPSKHQHEFFCPAACSFFVVSDAPFDIHYVDDAGNEIPMAQALKAKAAPKAAPKKP